MASLTRRITHAELVDDVTEQLLTREWLVTNGLGGYASGTIAGVATRRYHGLLVAALPAPLGRRMMLSHLSERLRLADGTLIRLSGEGHLPGDLHLYGADHLTEFRLEMGRPVWRFEVGGIVLEKEVVMPHEQNTVFVIYRLLDGPEPARLKLMPSVHNRSHDDPVSTPLPGEFRLSEIEQCFELKTDQDLPALRMTSFGLRKAFTVERKFVPEVLYRLEESRGYEHRGSLWSPGYFRFDLSREAPAALVASTEPWDVIHAMDPAAAVRAERERRLRRLIASHETSRDGMAAELVLAADQFIIQPTGRTEDAARVRAEGDEFRSVIAGYHWFTDWGRDTMISLEGLTLATGRLAEAGYILRTFAYSVRDGLLPNLFPEGHKEGLYHTADATLWFFHAIDRYLEASGDHVTVELLLPRLLEIVEFHRKGTRFGIGVDPGDGLLRQGAPGYQLTWMDAKVGDWVVTPRRGKAVEINALWYNALRLLAEWDQHYGAGGETKRLLDDAERARQSFNRRFWNAKGGYLYDVVDGEQGDDASFRPNQILAISLKYPVLEREAWRSVVDQVQKRLLTPVGLRSLSPDHPDYKPKYFGDLRARDAAYHQGTVWAWLIGPFIDAWLKVHPDDPPAARQFLVGFEHHLNEAGIGSISEVFDAELPFTPRGCIAQAWSVAEVLRCLVKTAPALVEDSRNVGRH
jgi:predicted glycogen debranching enzyme